jgi:hypothetical protein
MKQVKRMAKIEDEDIEFMEDISQAPCTSQGRVQDLDWRLWLVEKMSLLSTEDEQEEMKLYYTL